MEYCMSNIPKYYPLDPNVIAQDHLNFVINDVQPYYFIAESFNSAKNIITQYTNNIEKPFNLSYDHVGKKVKIQAENKIKMVSNDTTAEDILF